MSQKVQILLAVPHPLLLRGMRSQLTEDSVHFVTGEAITEEEIRRQLLEHFYDVVLLHQIFVKAIGDIIQVPFIVCMEKSIKSEFFYLLKNRYCYGYFPINGSFESLIRFLAIIDSQRRDVFWTDPLILLSMIDGTLPEENKFEYWGKMTPREREVFILWKQDCTNREIARRLNIEPCTVVTHKENIRHALGMTAQEIKRFLSLAPLPDTLDFSP
ncbi:MAG TPA: LuxR C-terminal-related transcriptional regulator [Ktedonobacteraceae bacterium]|nr:LuxR C-terminal-related transcriptional regulator [Ktedonobacteraceae bacterium]